MRRLMMTCLTVSAVAGCQTRSDWGSVFDGSAGRWVDLTHSFGDETIYWPTSESFSLERLSYAMTDAGYFYAANNFSAAEHGGTHLDAPVHFAEGRYHTDQIPLEKLIGPALIVDVSDHVDADYLVQVEDLVGWEGAHGPIAAGAMVFIHTGWGDRWPDRTRYLGTNITGPDAVPELHFPGISPEAAAWLAERQIAAIGIDTPSIDYGQSTSFESHVILYTANIPGFENVANLKALPATGSFVVALPMKIEGGSGGPLRIVGFIPQ